MWITASIPAYLDQTKRTTKLQKLELEDVFMCGYTGYWTVGGIRVPPTLRYRTLYEPEPSDVIVVIIIIVIINSIRSNLPSFGQYLNDIATPTTTSEVTISRQNRDSYIIIIIL